jgi:hypothetical protein
LIEKTEVRELILDLFEEEALAIGGLVAVHDVEDDLVWRLMRTLDVIRGRALRRLDDKVLEDEAGPPPRAAVKPHPAIEHFLLSLRTA